METKTGKIITVDGVQYIEYKYHNETYNGVVKKLNELKEAKENFGLIKPIINLADDENVMAIGSSILGEDYTTVSLSLSYLEKAIKMIRIIDSDEAVHLAIKKDGVFFIGKTKERDKRLTISGVCIAPRYSNE